MVNSERSGQKQREGEALGNREGVLSKHQKEIENIKKKMIPILKQYKVTKAGIFGSFARGEQKKKSDVDILIEMRNGADLIALAGLKLNLQEAIMRKVDIVEYRGIRKELKKNILNDEIQIEL